jgi:secreted PhoX family phosphatase
MSDDGGKQVHEFKHMDCIKICAGSYVCTFEGDDVLNGVVWEYVTNHPNNNGYTNN